MIILLLECYSNNQLFIALFIIVVIFMAVKIFNILLDADVSSSFTHMAKIIA